MYFNKLYNENSRDQADQHGSCIAHKNSCRRDIVFQKCNGSPCQGKGYYGQIGPVHQEKPCPQGNGDQGGNASRQAINSINQVECIDNDQDGKHGQQNGRNDWYFVYTEYPI